MENIFALIGFFVLNILAVITAVFITLHIKNYQITDKTNACFTATVLYISEIVIFEIILGIGNRLSSQNIFIAVLLHFVVWLSIFYKNKKRLIITETKKQSLNFFMIGAVFGPLTVLMGLRFFNTLFMIPLDMDVVGYHLPFVVEWIQTGSLRNIFYSAFAGPIGYYPSNYELLDLWVMLPFRNDFLVNFVNFPVLFLLGCAVYHNMRLLNIHRTIALTSTGLLLYMPVVLRQTGTALVDLFFATMFALSLYFLQEIWRKKSQGAAKTWPDILLFSLSLGLFTGTKYLGVMMAPPLMVLFITLLLKYRKKWSNVAKECAILFAGFMSTGSFFYIRNWLNSGNPVFPAEVKLGNWIIFEGYNGIKNRLFSSTLTGNIPDFSIVKKLIYDYFLHTHWQIFMIGAAVFAMIIFMVVLAMKKNKNSKDLAIASLLLVNACLYFYLYALSPNSYLHFIPNIRYSLPFLIIGILNLGFLVSRIAFLKPIFFFSVFAVFPISFFYLVGYAPGNYYYDDRILFDTANLQQFKPIFFYFIATLLLLFFSIQIFFKKKTLRRMATSLCLIGLSAVLLTNMMLKSSLEKEKMIEKTAALWFQDKDPKLKTLMNAALWIENNAPDANIAYTGLNFHYYFYGRNLERNADYVNINDCPFCRYIDYKNEPDSIRARPDYAFWLSNLHSMKKNYLVIFADPKKDIKIFEWDWVLSYPETFQQVFHENNTYIFKILDS